MTMSGHRYDRILASTALALILATPIAAGAAPRSSAPQVAAVPATTATAQPAAETTAATTPDALPPEITIPAPPAQPAAAKPEQTATETTVAPDPMAALDPADRPIAEKMRDLLAGKTDKIFTSKKERSAVDTFYQNRNFAPLWLDKGIENARAKAVI